MIRSKLHCGTHITFEFTARVAGLFRDLAGAVLTRSRRTTRSVPPDLPGASNVQVTRDHTSPSPQRIACVLRRGRLALALALFLPILAGCIYPERQHSQWRWKQFSPEYRPLPGDEAP